MWSNKKAAVRKDTLPAVVIHDPGELSRFHASIRISAKGRNFSFRARADGLESVRKAVDGVQPSETASLGRNQSSQPRAMILIQSVTEFSDRCACFVYSISPVGLMVVGEHGEDRRLFAVAAGIEAVISAS